LFQQPRLRAKPTSRAKAWPTRLRFPLNNRILDLRNKDLDLRKKDKRSNLQWKITAVIAFLAAMAGWAKVVVDRSKTPPVQTTPPTAPLTLAVQAR
jgi:hypothetical protein